MESVEPQRDVDEFDELPSNEEVFREYFGVPDGPEGIYLEPLIAGWPSANSINIERFHSRPSVMETLDMSTLQRTGFRPISKRLLDEYMRQIEDQQGESNAVEGAESSD
jgi:hypothetical protein